MLRKIGRGLKWILDGVAEGFFLFVMVICAFMFGLSVWSILNCFLCNNCT